MRKYLAVCEKFEFLDKFLQAILKKEIVPGNLYRMVEDESGIHMCLETDSGQRFIYLDSLKNNKDPRYKYSFKEADFEFVINKGFPLSEDPVMDVEWITSDHNPFKDFEERMKAEEKQVLIELEEDINDGIEIPDEEFLILSFKDLRKMDSGLSEGFLNSVEYSSDAFVEYSTPSSVEDALKQAKDQVEKYKESNNPFHLGMAQLMLYYVFSV